MADISEEMLEKEKLKNEISELETLLSNKKNEYRDYDFKKLRDIYGDRCSCENCRYDCTHELCYLHSYCIKGQNISNYDVCLNFKLNTNLSNLIKKYWHHDEDRVNGLALLLGFDDIEQLIDSEDTQDKAIEILKMVVGDKQD